MVPDSRRIPRCLFLRVMYQVNRAREHRRWSTCDSGTNCLISIGLTISYFSLTRTPTFCNSAHLFRIVFLPLGERRTYVAPAFSFPVASSSSSLRSDLRRCSDTLSALSHGSADSARSLLPRCRNCCNRAFPRASPPPGAFPSRGGRRPSCDRLRDNRSPREVRDRRPPPALDTPGSSSAALACCARWTACCTAVISTPAPPGPPGPPRRR